MDGENGRASKALPLMSNHIRFSGTIQECASGTERVADQKCLIFWGGFGLDLIGYAYNAIRMIHSVSKLQSLFVNQYKLLKRLSDSLSTQFGKISDFLIVNC